MNTCTATGTKVTNISPTAQQYMKDIYAKIPVPDTAYDIAHNLDPHTILSNFKNIYQQQRHRGPRRPAVRPEAHHLLSLHARYVPGSSSARPVHHRPIPGANTTTVVNPGTQHLGQGNLRLLPTLLLNAGYAFSNGNILTTPAGFLAPPNRLTSNPASSIPTPSASFPTIGVSGMTTLNGSIAYVDHGTNHQAFGDITKTLRNHTFIAGFSYNHYQKLENNTTGTQGSFTFANDAAFANVPVEQQLRCERSTGLRQLPHRQRQRRLQPALARSRSPTSRSRSTRASCRTTGR